MKKQIIIIVIILLLGGGAYIMIKGGAPASSTSATSKSRSASNIGAETFAALNKLESLKLDESIFSNPVYKKLNKTSVKGINIKAVGKSNPFDNGDGGFNTSEPSNPEAPAASEVSESAATETESSVSE